MGLRLIDFPSIKRKLFFSKVLVFVAEAKKDTLHARQEFEVPIVKNGELVKANVKKNGWIEETLSKIEKE